MKTAEKNKWFLNRLRSMSIQEILHRIKKQIELGHEKHHIHTIRSQAPPVPLVTNAPHWISVPREFVDQRSYIENADRIVKGRLNLFRLEVDAYDIVRNWNKDPKTKTQAPLVFGKTLDYRNPSVVGDIKYLWEPARHHHLVPLAQAYSLTHNEIYLKAILLHVGSWLDQCPYMLGPHWCSSLEVAIRVINWSIAWQLIGGNESALFMDGNGKIFRSRWLDSIYRHMAFISNHFSLYSSANNHLIGEAAGLFIASNTWPFWKEKNDRWRSVSYAILVDETVKQSYEDGVGREQAMAYHQFVLDFLILSLLSGKAAEITFPASQLARIEKMLDFLSAMMDTEGNVPMFGDADDGYVAKWTPPHHFCPYKSLLASGAFIFLRNDFLQRAQKIDDKTRWLLGKTVESITLPESEPESEEEKTKASFPSGGYYILSDRSGSEGEVKCVVDCGPIGYLSIAAHGHADALSLYLSVGGTEFLIDPGTYIYHGKHEWREYFRGTSAHNTVAVDHANQSLSGGNFLWTFKADAKVVNHVSTSDCDEFEGIHDGYRRLNDPVIHRRKVVFKKKQHILTVIDTIECLKGHDVERFWHFHEGCRVSLANGDLVAENRGRKIKITTKDADSRIQLYKGSKNPPLGWVSRRYDEKVASYTAVVTNQINRTSTLQTDIQILSST